VCSLTNPDYATGVAAAMDPSKHLRQKFEKRREDTSVRGLPLIYLRFVQRTETDELRNN
jgi:hypothetical protein